MANLPHVRWVIAAGAAAVLVLVSALPSAAASGERIASYDAALTVRGDGSLHVRETIDYDFGGAQRHGIEREILTKQRYDDGRDRRYPVSGIAVTSADAPAQTQITSTVAETTVRIGDPGRTITGRHTYVISYTVAAATTAFGDHDELYWNAYGPGWDIPVDAVTVRVTGAPVTTATCLMGRLGATAGCSSVAYSGSTASFRGGPLDAGAVLTVVIGFPPGSVAHARPLLLDRMTAGRFLYGRTAVVAPLVLLVIGGPLLLLVSALLRRRAQERPALGYRSEFRLTPPAGLRPLLANTLLSGSFNKVDPIAVLLDLSARGYLSIHHLSERNWRLARIRRRDDALEREERAVLWTVFGNAEGRTLADASGRLAAARPRLRASARAQVVDLGWYRAPPGTRGVIGPIVAMAVLALPLTVVLGRFGQVGLVGLAVFVGGVLLLGSVRLRPQPRTPAGEVARSQLIAFRRTLAKIDPSQLPPLEREAALDRMLPYAVALGLAPRLAAAFTPEDGAAVEGSGGRTSAKGLIGSVAPGTWWWAVFAADATRATSSASPGGAFSEGSGGSGFSGGSAGGGGGGGGGGSW